MWIRTGAFAMLSIRRMKGVGFGFWPKRGEWIIGIDLLRGLSAVRGFGRLDGRICFAARAPSGWITNLRARARDILRGVVGAGSGRGVLLPRPVAAVARNGLRTNGPACAGVDSVRPSALWLHAFPNWQMVAMAAVAGVFYGLAFRQARSIRASMVTHALTVTAWKMFFSADGRTLQLEFELHSPSWMIPRVAG